MKVFLASILAAVIVAGVANLVLTTVVQQSAEDAFSARSARP